MLAGRIAADGGEAITKTTDVKRRGDVSDLVDFPVERFGKLDALINNAGIGPVSPSTICASPSGTR